MRTPQPPFDGDDGSGNGTPRYEWLDEWLCEYVDGTMDPSLEVVFEKYVEANPELKAHVKRLRQTRELLCGCDRPEGPSTGAQTEVCSEVEEDLLQSSTPLSTIARKRPFVAWGVASSVAVALVVGFLAGSIFVDPTTLSPASSTASVSTVEQREPPNDRGAARLENSSSPRQQRGASFPARGPLRPRHSAESSLKSDTVGRSSVLTAVETR